VKYKDIEHTEKPKLPRIIVGEDGAPDGFDKSKSVSII